jgi:hypothetical protein
MAYNLPPTAAKEVKRDFRGHPEPRQETSSPAPLFDDAPQTCRFVMTLWELFST